MTRFLKHWRADDAHRRPFRKTPLGVRRRSLSIETLERRLTLSSTFGQDAPLDFATNWVALSTTISDGGTIVVSAAVDDGPSLILNFNDVGSPANVFNGYGFGLSGNFQTITDLDESLNLVEVIASDSLGGGSSIATIAPPEFVEFATQAESIDIALALRLPTLRRSESPSLSAGKFLSAYGADDTPPQNSTEISVERGRDIALDVATSNFEVDIRHKPTAERPAPELESGVGRESLAMPARAIVLPIAEKFGRSEKSEAAVSETAPLIASTNGSKEVSILADVRGEAFSQWDEGRVSSVYASDVVSDHPRLPKEEDNASLAVWPVGLAISGALLAFRRLHDGTREETQQVQPPPRRKNGEKT